MEVAFIHLSDCHFQNASDPLLKRVDLLAASILSRVSICDFSFLVYSGDISFSGNNSQFKIADKFSQTLKIALEDAGCPTEIVICPGNHDSKLLDDDSVRDAILREILREPKRVENTQLQERLQECQTNYFRFAHSLQPQISATPTIHDVLKFEVNEQTIQFHVLNTAMMSTLQETQGGLHFPTDLLLEQTDIQEALQVFVLHHPLNWFESSCGHKLREILSSRADLVLTGHEHLPHSSTVHSNTLATTTEYFEGAVLQEYSDSDKSAYQIFRLNFQDTQVCNEVIRFDGKKYASNLEELDWRPIKISKDSLEEQQTSIHRDWLRDVGANFTHPRKRGKLNFYDLFIPPDLRELIDVRAKSSSVERASNSREITRLLNDGTNVVILGQEQSGKTHFVKHFINEQLPLGQLCVYIDCSKVKRLKTTGEVERLIHKTVHDQFQGSGRTRFLEANKDHRILILDDYHTFEVSDKEKLLLLEYGNNNFKSVLVVADEVLQLDGLIGDFEALEELIEFTWFRLLELGHVKRERLIERWIEIGRVESVSDTERDRELVRTKRLVDQLIGQKLLPPTPINLLILLQQIEVLRDNPSATAGSSNGHLYTMLINDSLNKHLKILALDGSINYLTQLACEIYEKRSKSAGLLSLDEFRIFHSFYQEEFDQIIPSEILLHEFSKSGILFQTSDGCVGFKYKYIFYYFAARSIAHNQNLNDELKILVDDVHTETACNILIFLSFHSIDPKIVEQLVSKADSQFAKVEPCDLSKHNCIAEQLVMSSPKFELPNSNARANREVMGRQIDTQSTDSGATEMELDDQQGLELNTAFKTLQVLGQILRNTAESGRAKAKREILDSTVSLGLRSLGYFVESLENEIDELLDYIAGQVISDESISARQKTELAQRILSSLLEAVCYVFVKKITNAVGTQKLEQTYQSVFNNGNLTNRLIDLSIRLDHFAVFPSNEVDKLCEQIQPYDLLSRTLLRRLVATHFYLRDEKKSTRDKYCRRLEISQSGNLPRNQSLERPKKSLR